MITQTKQMVMRMMNVWLVLALIAISGCDKSKEDEQHDTMLEGIENMVKGMEASEGKEEAIKREIAADRGVLHPKAIEQFKSAIETQFGTEVAKKAEYEVVRVKDFGDAKWEVHGLYRGLDGQGRKMEADWVVTMEVWGGNLQTMRTSLGERRYIDK